ncbi:MAG TPA: putative Fe-S cluster assembly protein SufT [Deltaproteobacteria bacterium]|nr:putative Fe-S cluster assembly protein SufT [Deltaproteobacteria bacterium]
MGRPMEEVLFSRETEVILIPDGFTQLIPEGSRGWITQVLGGNYTVQLETGRLVRVGYPDADAIGKEEEASGPDEADPDAPVDEERIWSALRGCYDPEIPLNIVELGLIYGLELSERPDGDHDVSIEMTLTAPGCGMGQILADDVEMRIRAIPGVKDVRVDLTFDPPWSPERMSEEGRLELGMFY